MFTLLYILAFLLFIPPVYAYYVEHKFLRKLEDKEEKFYGPPILTMGKKLAAFTIEKTAFISASIALDMNCIRRFLYWILRFFYRTNMHTKILMDLAMREVMVRLREKNQGCDYIVNLHVETVCLGRRTVLLHAYATSIKLYKDTLGLYFIPEIVLPHDVFTMTNTLLRQLIIPIFLVIGLIVGIYKSDEHYRIRAINEITPQYEKIIGNYLTSSSFIESRNLKPHLVEAENYMRELLKKSRVADDYPEYDLEVFLIDNESAKAYILPSGKIVIYKGLLRKLRSENNLVFIIAYLTAHLKDSEHIKNLDEYLINPFIFINTFGEDSFIAKIVTRLSPFYYVEFTKDQEIEALRYGLNLTQNLYNGIGAHIIYENLFRHTDLGKSDEITTDEINSIINEYKESEPAPLKYILDEPIIQQSNIIFSKVGENTNTFEGILSDFNNEYQEILNKYIDSMKFIPGLTNPQNLSSKERLDYNIKLIAYGNNTIDFYAKAENDLVARFAIQVKNELSKIQDPDKKILLNAAWERQLNQLQVITDFYFKRDRETLKSLIGAMNFLYKRVGRYGIKDGVIIFSSKNDQLSYEGLMERVKKELNKQPPVRN